MSIIDGQAKLHKSMKDLRIRWQLVRQHWNDPMAEKFEERYMIHLEKELRSASAAMDHIGSIIQRIRQECS